MKNLQQILLMTENFVKKASSKNKTPPKTNSIKTILQNLQDLETFESKKKYAEKNLEHLSSGSSRIVFKLGKDKVLKLASNEKGVAQNKAEAGVQEDCKYINKTIRRAKNYSWVISPIADKITEREFFDLTGVNFRQFGECIKYNASKNKSNKEEPENFEELKDEEVVKQISDIISKYSLIAGDVARISSWKVKDGTPVLVDLGLNESIYKEYYAKSSGS